MTTATTALTNPGVAYATPILDAHDTLTVVAWHDATIEQTPGAIPTGSDDALVWHTQSIGCIGMAMAHRFAGYATEGPSMWTIADIAPRSGSAPHRPACCAASTISNAAASSAVLAARPRCGLVAAADLPPTWSAPRLPRRCLQRGAVTGDGLQPLLPAIQPRQPATTTRGSVVTGCAPRTAPSSTCPSPSTPTRPCGSPQSGPRKVPGRGVVVRCPTRRWVGGRGLGW